MVIKKLTASTAPINRPYM